MTKVPNLRFKEFSGEWSFSTLDSVCTINPRTKELPNDFYYIDLESVQKGMLSDVSIINKTNAPSRAQRLLSAGDILFQTVRPYQQNNYLFKEENGFPTVASTGYAQIRAHQNNKFLYYLLHTSNFNKNVLIRCTGSNYPAINSTDLSDIDICLPSIGEQEKIASFFSLIDKKIELQTEKVEELKKYKKGIMQKIFSQELRFKDENGNEFPEWAKCKIYDCFVERSEKGFEDLELLSVSMGNGVIKRSEIDGKDNSSENKSNYKLVKKDDIVYNSMRMWQGASGLSEYEGIVSPAYTVLTPKKDIYSSYFSYLFKTHKMIHEFRKYSQGLTSDTWNLKYPQIKDIKVNVPSYEEQVKISQFFKKVDIKIEKEQDILKGLIEYKKGLLQQMFI